MVNLVLEWWQIGDTGCCPVAHITELVVSLRVYACIFIKQVSVLCVIIFSCHACSIFNHSKMLTCRIANTHVHILTHTHVHIAHTVYMQGWTQTQLDCWHGVCQNLLLYIKCMRNSFLLNKGTSTILTHLYVRCSVSFVILHRAPLQLIMDVSRVYAFARRSSPVPVTSKITIKMCN